MKILIVGLGSVGQRHVRNLGSLLGPEIDLIAYRVRKYQHVITNQVRIDPANVIEAKYGIKTYNDLDKALEELPDIAFICNPSSLHIPVAMRAAGAGCHLFIEKPISFSYKGVEELISLAEEKNLIAQVGCQLRFHPTLISLRSLLQTETLGRVLAVRAVVGEYLPDWHTYEDYRQSYASSSSLGGGVILTQIHDLDYLYWLFGMPKRLFALGGHLSSLEIDVEDTASILMECDVGGRSIPVHLQQDYIQSPPTRKCEVLCDKGRIIADFVAPELQIYNERGIRVENRKYDSFDRNQLFLDEIDHFLNCIKNELEPIVNLRDGANSLWLALLAKESIRTGKSIELV